MDKKLVVAVALTLALAPGVHASDPAKRDVAEKITSSIDQSDLWWNPNESGWGMQIVHEAGLQFATLFVYGASGQPTFFVGVLNPVDSASWTGDLYATTGPWFGGTFNPASVTTRKVGTLTFSAPLGTSGTISYSVDGVTVNKTVERQLLRRENYSGQYVYIGRAILSGCSNPTYNGSVPIAPQNAFVSHNGTSIAFSFSVPDQPVACNYVGNYEQFGRLGSVSGTFSCGPTAAGSFTMTELKPSAGSFSGRLRAQMTSGVLQGCEGASTFTALKVD